MRGEKDKMLAGELYDPLDPQLAAERRRARDLVKALNDSRDGEQGLRARLSARNSSAGWVRSCRPWSSTNSHSARCGSTITQTGWPRCATPT
jgi:hypothetical protein